MDNLCLILCSCISKKVLNNIIEWHLNRLFEFWHCPEKMFIFDELPYPWTIKNTPALIFSIDRRGNAIIRYLKQSPAVGNALINCFMRRSFMCRGGNIIFVLSTSGSSRMLGSPGLRSVLGGQFIPTQCFSRALLSHMHRKQGYFVCPRCWPRRKATILRSTQNTGHTLSSVLTYQWTVGIQLNCRSQSKIPPVNHVYVMAIHKATVTLKVLQICTVLSLHRK